jgi:hypothetical protein
MFRWYKRWKQQRECFHHELPSVYHPELPAQSWIKSQLIETGKAKMFWCTGCEKTWIT